MIIRKRASAKIIDIARNGGVGVIPTDTIYGVVGSALRAHTVRNIYKLRKRNPKKPMIVLIGSPSDLATFGVRLHRAIKRRIQKFWPGKVSIILPCASKKFSYLHRGTKAIAFRLPAHPWLRALLQKTGPLVAPSANIEGKPPARTIAEAQKYFGDRVDFYLDGGYASARPSKIVRIEANGRFKTIRP